MNILELDREHSFDDDVVGFGARRNECDGDGLDGRGGIAHEPLREVEEEFEFECDVVWGVVKEFGECVYGVGAATDEVTGLLDVEVDVEEVMDEEKDGEV